MIKLDQLFLSAPEFHKRDITNLDIAAQAMIFFFAGFESVTSVMAFMAYELAVNPDIQKKLRDEVQETSSECGGKLTYEALMKMKYLDMVISGKKFFKPHFIRFNQYLNRFPTVFYILYNNILD